MIRTGMVSITFRKYTPEKVMQLTNEAGLKYIEWGGDVHVPPHDIKNARSIGEQTREMGLGVAAYGSYYRVGSESPNATTFEQNLEAAIALGAPLIRVWAGSRASEEAHDHHWRQVIEEGQVLADMADQAGICLALEFHGNTLNDTVDASRRLLSRIKRDNVTTLWQTDGTYDIDKCREQVRSIRKHMSNLHVFHWNEGQRRPLDDAYNLWRRVFEIVVQTERDHVALLEFVKDDSVKQFQDDADTLKDLVRKANRPDHKK